jgi:CubicO group peptidase (beta-lactamase class C family)
MRGFPIFWNIMLPIAIPESAAEQKKQFAVAYAVLESRIREHALPGAAFGVLSQGKTVALDGVGTFVYPEDIPGLVAGNRPVTPFAIYDLASITKVLATTAVAMLLYDRGVLDLEEPVGEILPGFVIGSEPGGGKSRVTLRMLLAHSSGLPGYARLFESHSTPPQMLRACLQLPLDALPGTRAEYSDIGFILLGTALEVLSGQKLATLCASEIFTPLGMTQTLFCPPVESRLAIPPTENDISFRYRVIQGDVHDENCFALGGATGHAGLFSGARDVLRFAECILGGGKINAGETQLFQRKTVELFATRQDSPAGTSRALGWDTPTVPSSSGSFFGGSSIGHLGFTGTSLWIDRDREVAVVLLTNRTWPYRNRAMEAAPTFRRIRSLFHDAVMEAI